MSMEERLAYLRSRGVEIDPIIDKSGEKKPARREEKDYKKNSSSMYIVTYVKIPCDAALPMIEETAELKDGEHKDALKEYLGSRFYASVDLDEATVERESRTQISNMVTSHNLAAPSTDTIRNIAKNRPSIAEAYPLSNPTSENNYIAVKMYIDEIGALRKRPRNTRAESVAAECAGLESLHFCGDVYIGCIQAGGRNHDFTLADIKPDAKWAINARCQHSTTYQQMSQDAASMRSGQHDSYTWTQTDEDLEIRVRIPSELLQFHQQLQKSNDEPHMKPPPPPIKKSIRLSLGKGDSLLLNLNGAPLLHCPRLFNKVSVDDASWTLDDNNTTVVLSLEKLEPAEWTFLHFDEV